MDHKALLAKYIAFLWHAEGVDHIDSGYPVASRYSAFSKEDIASLEECRRLGREMSLDFSATLIADDE